MRQIRLVVGLFLVLILIATTGLCAGGEEGRYQAVNITALEPAMVVFIIDTKEGHIWTWGAMFQEDPERKITSALVYEGKVRPGKASGELVDGRGLPRSEKGVE